MFLRYPNFGIQSRLLSSSSLACLLVSRIMDLKAEPSDDRVFGIAPPSLPLTRAAKEAHFGGLFCTFFSSQLLRGGHA